MKNYKHLEPLFREIVISYAKEAQIGVPSREATAPFFRIHPHNKHLQLILPTYLMSRLEKEVLIWGGIKQSNFKTGDEYRWRAFIIDAETLSKKFPRLAKEIVKLYNSKRTKIETDHPHYFIGAPKTARWVTHVREWLKNNKKNQNFTSA